MKRTRVAFFAEILTEDFDGAVRTIYQIINWIDKSRFEFLFIYGSGSDNIKGFESLKVPAVTIPFNTNYTMALPFLKKKRLEKKLIDFSADIIHISTPSLLGRFALDFAVKHHLPVITIYHTHFISYVDYYLKYTPFLIKSARKFMKNSHKIFYNNCNLVYVPSYSIKEELRNIGISNSKLTIWKRGIDNAIFSPLKRNTRLVKSLTGNSNPTIIFASRLVWEKNLETLFAINELLQQQLYKYNFIVVGEGPAKKACKLKMKNAIFIGKANHVYLAELYASCDVFLFPSVSETYGNVVAEAMASGLPCVIANDGGSKDFIDNGINGFKCEPYNAADYVEKIIMILNNRKLSNKFAAEGLKFADSLSWEQLTQVYFDEITGLVNKNLTAVA